MSHDRRKAIYERRDLRPEAEEAANKNVAASSGQLSVEKLLHELQVHQIELEMQNDELRRSHITLEESRDRYFDLFEFAPIAYITVNEQGLITEANFTSSKLLGVVRKKLINRPFSRYIVGECINEFHLYLSNLHHEPICKNCDTQIKCEDGSYRYVHIETSPVKSESGVMTLRITLIDITERKLAEEQLAIAATAFEAQEGIMVTDANNLIIRVNKAFSHITGYNEKEVIGKLPNIFKSNEHDALFYESMWQKIRLNNYWQGEIWNKRKNGEIFPAMMTITAVTSPKGTVTHYVGSFLDITLQKQAEKVLLNAREHLEDQVEKTVAELMQAKVEAHEVNTALKVMIKLRETEGAEAKDLLIQELKQEVMPFLQSLKNNSREPKQVRLLSALDANLQRLISSYGSSSGISSLYKNLTPKEIQIASMVREGIPTKTIAATLSLSAETISVHRKNIRKKLGLESKGDNLRSYLIALDK